MLHKKIFAAVMCSLALLCISSAVSSQNNSLGFWNNVTAKYYLNDKWNLSGEAQVRSQELVDQFFYYQLTGGLNYKLNKNYAILLGTGQYATYSNGGDFKSPVLSREFRVWEQFTLVNNIDRFKIEHRFRIEQRWRTDGYRNRFRYRLNLVIPINKPTVDKGTLYVSIYDEILLTNTRQYFESNLVFGGLGYGFSSSFMLQIGWIRRFDYSNNNTGSKKDFLQTTLIFRINSHKSDREHHPGSMN